MRPPGAPRAPERGYVLLGVLLVSVLLTSMVLGLSRHTVMVADAAKATVATLSTEDAADSGLAWARQSLLADGSSSASLDMGDGRRVSVSLADAGAGLRTIQVLAEGHGVEQGFDARAEVYATSGARIPELTSDARAAVSASASLIEITGTVTYSDTELSGLLLLRDGADLTLDDVVLVGSIVSEAALFPGATTATLRLRDGVLVSPGAELPGVALAAPGVAVIGDGTERVQLEGIVIAGSLSLPGQGAVHGQVATSTAPALSASVDLVGGGRAPRAWPDAIDTRSADVGRLSFPVADPTATEQSAIRDYSFPADGGGALAPVVAPGG